MESKILPIEKIIGYILDKNKSVLQSVSPTNAVSYSWGDQQELTSWILAKDDEIAGMRAFGNLNVAKYPLIWMVTPIDGLLQHDENLFENVTFIICSNTKAEWLNSTREAETMPMLTDMANLFLEVLTKDKNASIIRWDGHIKVKFRKVYNYSVSKGKESETIDIWDAISLTFDLKINTNCLINLQLCL